ncbi:crispr-associated protein, family [Sulfurihydrogenibium azorense Az-Fu1]|uniref:Crispr-associated protein, family n=1 Tax=Sulfurihydrogenibium azorense (strain DSM 15241 / OCM 825 / Az-Fu1) TaxID=204536 RepID=C1DUR3_SULAA|nr:TIGR02556 family CRISPR-associated protein [Sulfurihydrogenibium azorense]ACN98938.1 crispr-associated protein, family [Sulfurihydrogenibium azorense Az-Fu1]
MIEAVRNLGEFVLQQENKSEIDILLENPNSGNYNKVIVLNFNKDFTFSNITTEDFKKDNWRVYLYRRKSSNGPDFTPTARVTEPKKTIENKIIKWFEEHRNENQILKKMYEELIKNKNDILNEVEKRKSSKDEGIVLTVKIDGKYLYEIDNPNFKEIFIKDFYKRLKDTKSKNACCSLCGEVKDEVFTTSEIYKFYTLDKPGYIAGGFNKSNAWKNFPVCESCYLKVDYGRKYIEEHLEFNFYGKTYYIIPNVILNTKEVMNEYLDILSEAKKRVSLKDKNPTEDENYIINLLKDHKDGLCFYFLFLKKENSAERILLLIEDVLPSRISKIFKVKKEVEKIFNIENYNFGFLTQFLGNYDKIFFEVIDKIFRGGKLDFQTLLQIFTKKIRDEFLSGNSITNTVIYALMNVRFFEELGLLESKEGKMEKTKFDEIYEKVGKSLNTPAKRGIFLLGALTQMLLDIQWSERKTTPFFKNLKGLKMNEEDIKGLLPKVVNKLMEYERYDKGKQELAQEISKNLLSQEKFGLSINEINFYFVSGMALSEEVANIIKKEKNFEIKEESSDVEP